MNGPPKIGTPRNPGIRIPPGREKAPLAHKTNTLMLKEKCTAYLAGGGVLQTRPSATSSPQREAGMVLPSYWEKNDGQSKRPSHNGGS